MQIFGRGVQEQRKLIGYVPQRSSVDWDFPTSVGDAVLMGAYGQMGWVRRPGKHHRQMTMEALAKVGMSDLADRQINELSGGQQQRVFLARALIQMPTSTLWTSRSRVWMPLRKRPLWRSCGIFRPRGKTVVVVHHDLQTVHEYFDWLTLLNLRKIASGPMALTLTETNLHQAYGIPVTGNGVQ